MEPMFQVPGDTSPDPDDLLVLPSANLVKIDFDHLESTLQYYEDERYSFVDGIPRLSE